MEIKKNMIEAQDKEDTSNYPVVRKEITLLKLDRIVSEISNRNEFTIEKHRINSGSRKEVNLLEGHDIKVSLESLESYRFVKNWILEELSNEALKELYVIKYTNSERFKFKQDKIINFSTISISNN